MMASNRGLCFCGTNALKNINLPSMNNLTQVSNYKTENTAISKVNIFFSSFTTDDIRTDVLRARVAREQTRLARDKTEWQKIAVMVGESPRGEQLTDCLQKCFK